MQPPDIRVNPVCRRELFQKEYRFAAPSQKEYSSKNVYTYKYGSAATAADIVQAGERLRCRTSPTTTTSRPSPSCPRASRHASSSSAPRFVAQGAAARTSNMRAQWWLPPFGTELQFGTRFGKGTCCFQQQDVAVVRTPATDPHLLLRCVKRCYTCPDKIVESGT
ncbi:hypothetical protein ON010_g18195 [Phytophthora cinnamomi]|nr:hypothetical protein ON010_g18195 [Phytophthora cinnamomi]